MQKAREGDPKGNLSKPQRADLVTGGATIFHITEKGRKTAKASQEGA